MQKSLQNQVKDGISNEIRRENFETVTAGYITVPELRYDVGKQEQLFDWGEGLRTGFGFKSITFSGDDFEFGSDLDTSDSELDFGDDED